MAWRNNQKISVLLNQFGEPLKWFVLKDKTNEVLLLQFSSR
jgi:hypothetical protein